MYIVCYPHAPKYAMQESLSCNVLVHHAPSGETGGATPSRVLSRERASKLHVIVASK